MPKTTRRPSIYSLFSPSTWFPYSAISTNHFHLGGRTIRPSLKYKVNWKMTFSFSSSAYTYLFFSSSSSFYLAPTCWERRFVSRSSCLPFILSFSIHSSSLSLLPSTFSSSNHFLCPLLFLLLLLSVVSKRGNVPQRGNNGRSMYGRRCHGNTDKSFYVLFNKLHRPAGWRPGGEAEEEVETPTSFASQMNPKISKAGFFYCWGRKKLSAVFGPIGCCLCLY